jgi:CBS domain-containing protein
LSRSQENTGAWRGSSAPQAAKTAGARVDKKTKQRGNAMKIGEFLKSARQRLVTCAPDDTLDAAAKLLHAHAIGAMPVCQMMTRMVGIVSERDLVRTFATKGCDLRDMRVRDIMTTRVISCAPDDTMQEAQEIMRKNRFRHLPVVEGGRVLGILSIRDTLALRLQESEYEINVLRDVVVAARYR